MNRSTVNIAVTGDFCPHNRIEELALRSDYDSIFNDFRDVFDGNDLNITDLECPLTLSDKARRKTGPHQKADPSCASVLRNGGFGLAALANNHIMDYGSEGIEETLKALDSNSIRYLGLGKSMTEASAPYVFEKSGRKIAFLNYADNEFITSPDQIYTCNPLNPVRCFYDIRNAKTENDFLVVIVHAGNEFYELPSPRTKALYRYICDLGADVVIAHHTHAFSGFEEYGSSLIFYGLGNFIYDWPGKTNSAWNRGYIVKLTFTEKIEYQIIPLKQGDINPGVFHLERNETGSFESELNRLNSIISDDDLLEQEFRKYCKSVYPMYDAFIEPYFGRYITALRKRGFFPRILTSGKRLFLLNLARCDSHRDVLIRMLGSNEI